MKTYKSNGKLLLTGEYVVLDSALSLAIPTKFGQSLNITNIKKPIVQWKSFDVENNVWFETAFKLSNNKISLQSQNNNDKTNRLLDILQVAKQLNPGFLTSGCQIETHLSFPRNWGLGSSSTLINNVAQWAQVDAYKLLEQTFGGSGYDIACAQHKVPITYQLGNNKHKTIKEVYFNPSFRDALYFVYLNKKQNSRDGIAQYRENTSNKADAIDTINDITLKLISCSTLKGFEILINKHEIIIASIINKIPVKEKLFPDFEGSIKSLGAWGGDFVLVASRDNPTSYFTQKGYDTIIPYTEMITQ